MVADTTFCQMYDNHFSVMDRVVLHKPQNSTSVVQFDTNDRSGYFRFRFITQITALRILNK